MVIGTSCRFSERRCAVTVISWISPPDDDGAEPAAASDSALPLEALPNIAAIAQQSLGFEFMGSLLRYMHQPLIALFRASEKTASVLSIRESVCATDRYIFAPRLVMTPRRKSSRPRRSFSAAFSVRADR